MRYVRCGGAFSQQVFIGLGFVDFCSFISIVAHVYLRDRAINEHLGRKESWNTARPH